MPKSRSSSRKHGSKPSNAAVLASKLYTVAHSLTRNPDSPKADYWAETLSDITLKCLLAGKDKPIALALELANEAGDPDAWEEISFTAEYEAETQTLTALEVGEAIPLALAGAAETSVNCQLFAIPIFSTAFSRLTSGAIRETDYFNELVRSIRAEGIIGAGPTVVVENYLYHPEELDNLGWSKTQGLSLKIIQSRTPSRSPYLADPAAKGQTGWPQGATPMAEGTLCLRYLVGVLVGLDVSEFPLLCPVGETGGYPEVEGAEDGLGEQEDDEEGSPDVAAWFARMECWQSKATVLFEKMLGIAPGSELLQIDPIGDYFNSYRAGYANFKLIGFKAQFDAVLVKNDVEPRGVRAILVLYENEAGDETVSASLMSVLDDALIGSCTYKIEGAEEAYDKMADVGLMLEECGVAGITIVEDPQPLQHCECCGETTFFVDRPAGEAAKNGRQIPQGHTHAVKGMTRLQ